MDTDHARADDLAELRAVFSARPRVPALGWDAVHAFEQAHGVVLPEPYRTFVAEIADGCPDGPPAYGLLPLAKLTDDWDGDPVERDLTRPFPLTEAWMGSDDPRPDEEIDPLADAVVNDGSVVLGTDGCGMYWHLVVSGPHRGHLWLTTDEGAAPFGSAFGHTTADPGFTGWVRHWAAGREWFDRS